MALTGQRNLQWRSCSAVVSEAMRISTGTTERCARPFRARRDLAYEAAGQNCVNYCSLTFVCDPDFVFQGSGKSGMSLERDGLNGLISAIRSGQVTDIIVADTARLARRLAHVASLMQLCA
ncbi:recombinase family protein [Bradyrhizobium yuanmingense]|uniref:recombinase family protein n=1 Tax=Bradyrhizobium yuanmingense TaxID=108015 RepID=UPI003516634C